MYRHILLPHFKRELKRFLKKYPLLPESLLRTLTHFQKENHLNLGNNVYKVRLSSKDIRKGKSKSFRLIVLVIEVEKFLVPVTLYFKGEQVDISKKEIGDHLEIILFELRNENLIAP